MEQREARARRWRGWVQKATALMSAGESTRGRAYNPLLRSYPDSRKINACGIWAELLYVRLIARADDTGRYWAAPRKILGKLLTDRWERQEIDEAGVEAALGELEGAGLVERYEVEGVPYLAICKVYRALKSDRPALVEFPPPPGSAPDPSRIPNGATATATATTQPNLATDPATARADAREAAVDNPFGREVAAVAAAACSDQNAISPAWAKVEKFLGSGSHDPLHIAAARNWVFLKDTKAESAVEKLIAWSRRKKNHQGAFLAAIVGNYADDHAR